MSVEELMLDIGADLGMTLQQEINMYGMSKSDIREQYMNSITAKTSGLGMVVMGIMSDCQEMLNMGAGPRSVDYVRKQMNIGKYILSEMMTGER